MIRNIIASSFAALALGALTIAPIAADAHVGNGPAHKIGHSGSKADCNTASVYITAVYPTFVNIETTSGSLASWTQAGPVPFYVGVGTNDANGYTFSFSDGGTTGAPFQMVNAIDNSQKAPFTISDQAGETLSENTQTAAEAVGGASLESYEFNANLPDPHVHNLSAGTYIDGLTVTVNLL